MSIDAIEHELCANLRSWVHAVRVLMTEADFSSINNTVRAHVRDTFLRVAYRCNSQHPLFTLPEALLRYIITLAGSESIWAISGTCKGLRAFCFATPSLWQTVQFFGGQSSSKLGQLTKPLALHIERSRPEQSLELRLSNLILSPVPNSTFMSLLAAAIPRTRWLSIAPRYLDDWIPWKPVLCEAAPALEVALLEVPYPGIPNSRLAILPQDLFGGESPNLRQLTLSGAWLAHHSYPALVNLRYFKWMRYDVAIDTPLFCQVLAGLPCLEGLSLSVMSFAWDSLSFAESRIGARRLRHLALEAQEASNIVECLKDLGVQCFVHRLPYPPITMDAVLDWSASASLGLHISEFIARPPWSEKPLIARSLPLGLGNDCASQDVGFIPTITRESFASVTTLSIHEFLWPMKIGLGHPVPFPALRNLRIVLGSSDAYQQPPFYFDMGLLIRVDEHAVFHTPALHTLSVDHVVDCACHPRPSLDRYLVFDDEDAPSPPCSCDKVLYVSLRDVHHLITTLLTGWRPRLPLLTLSGVETIDMDARACEQLIHSIAEEVVMSKTARPNNSDATGYIWLQENIARIFEESLV